MGELKETPFYRGSTRAEFSFNCLGCILPISDKMMHRISEDLGITRKELDSGNINGDDGYIEKQLIISYTSITGDYESNLLDVELLIVKAPEKDEVTEKRYTLDEETQNALEDMVDKAEDEAFTFMKCIQWERALDKMTDDEICDTEKMNKLYKSIEE